jgi:para-nitrobenzyl esterase
MDCPSPPRRFTRRAVALSLTTFAATSAARGLAATDGDFPVVRTSRGPIRGRMDGGVAVFKGVRYGADTAMTRFAAPMPPEPWREVRDAFAYGPAAPQSHAAEAASEDCLFLNVWTPGVGDGRRRRPVMVYIHGGAYATGSGSDVTYDGTRLARRGDVVVVTINHRLNAFGYAYFARFAPGFEDSGNAGTLDQILALQWVRDNIATFGGDPNQVMLFGQSGGGAKIATLMAVSAAKGLFHRAATMSGQQLTASGPLHAAARAETYLRALGLKPDQVADIRRLPPDALVKALAERDPIIGSGGLYFGPVLDERTLERHPFYPNAPAQSAHIPMIIGNAHDETRYFLGRNDASAFTLRWEDLPKRLAKEMRVDIQPELVVETYRGLYPAYSPSDVFFAATTASRSWRAAVVEAEMRAAQGSPAFVYQLNWRSPIEGGKFGAFHTLDIPMVFDTVAAGAASTGGGADAQGLSDQMSEAFLAFARTGDPSTAKAPWAPYRLAHRETRVFDTVSRMEDDPRGAERRLFEAVPFIQQGT